jgi:hypothetical protein
VWLNRGLSIETSGSPFELKVELISPFSKFAVFLGFDVHGPSGGCNIWFQKAELKKDLTRLRSEAKTSLFF